MKCLYIAGPMTGLPDFNYPAFNAAEEQLLAAGYKVCNPVRSDLVPTAPRVPDSKPFEWEDYMRNGINQLIRCEGVALLPGWFKSKGARIEEGIAQQLGMVVRDVEGWLRVEEAVAA